jgi:O-antigen/teichoic acid export membrane protein
MHLIRRNLGWMMLSQCSTFLLSLVLLVIVPHKLGDTAFGQLSFAVVYVGFFDLLALFGTATFIIKVVSRDGDSVGHIVFNSVVLKTVIATGLSVVAIGLAVGLQFDGEIVVLIAISCIGMFVNALNSGVVGGLYGLQRMRGPALADLLRAYIAGALGIIIICTSGSLNLLVLSGCLTQLIPFFLNLRQLWPEIRGHWRVDTRVWKFLLRGGVPFFIWSALATFYGSIDIPILHAYAGDQTVGWYALAYRWINMPIFFASVVGTAFMPALSAEGVKVTESFVRLANRGVYIVALVTVPAAVGLVLVSHDFLDLIYGGQFSNTVPIMQILALQIPIISVDIILATVVIAADRQRQWVIVGVVAALFNPLMNLVALPLSDHLWGNAAIGAAAVTVLTECILMVGALVLCPAGVMDRSTTGLLGRIVLAAGCMVPVVMAFGPAPVAVKVAVGAATYAAASIAFRTASIKDMRQLAFGSVPAEEQPTRVPA